MAGCEIRSVYASIAGNHMQCCNSHGIVRDPRSRSDVRPTSTACSKRPRPWPSPPTSKMLHDPAAGVRASTIQEGVREPIGMTGVRLEVQGAHGHLRRSRPQQNISKCVRRCGLEIDDLILQRWRPAMAVLTDDENELGVVPGRHRRRAPPTSRSSLQGAIRHTAVDPDRRRPGDQRHRDMACARPTQDAEEIKMRYACALAQAGRSPGKPSRCQASATVRRASCPARRWRKRWSRVTRRSSR